ncbi:FAD-binding protein [Opitutaceae bacterium]|nr:FAD-binding protein [Opitutaceae bacterium]
MSEPTSESEVIEAVRSHGRLLPVGAGTKSRLSSTDESTHRLDLRQLTGITEYEASEYTITARAGTTLREINATLAEKGQYLPFDPLWVESGATLGGTVAANAAGPGRLRFGGVRDFVIGVRLIDGRGRTIRGGGKVVKNAAGFDLPKLMVGSLGTMGVMTEISCKVFPQPEAWSSREWTFSSHQEALKKATELSRSRFEPDALEYVPAECRLVLRSGGPAESQEALNAAIGGDPGPDQSWWSERSEFTWANNSSALIRIATSPRQVTPLLEALTVVPDTQIEVSAAGNTVWINSGETSQLDEILQKHRLTGLVHRGEASPLWLGIKIDRKIDAALQAVFDPEHRFAIAS